MEFKRINPTRYHVKIDSPEQVFLVFNESFNPEWKINLLNSSSNNSSMEHFMANGYANCWYLPKGGSHEILLVFWPQVFFRIGSTISILTLILIVIGYTKNVLTKKRS